MSPRNTSFPLITRHRGSYCAQFDGTSGTLFYVSALLCTSSTNQILVQVQQHFCQNTLDTQFELYLLCGGKIVSYVKTPARNLAVLSKNSKLQSLLLSFNVTNVLTKKRVSKICCQTKNIQNPLFPRFRILDSLYQNFLFYTGFDP